MEAVRVEVSKHQIGVRHRGFHAAATITGGAGEGVRALRPDLQLLEVACILKKPDLVALYKQLAADPGGDRPEDMQTLLQDERERCERVTKTAGIKED